MKFILLNPTMEKLAEIKAFGLPVVYKSDTEIHIELPEINESELSSGPVDLGLSVKWASCNVGATSPCESGLLFQFGRTDGYTYGSTDHQFSSTNPPATTSGTVYNAGDTLSLTDDAAHAAMGGSWRMPTKDEIEELLSDTTNTWVSCITLGDGHEGHTAMGRLFVSKTDETKKIFIPAAGCFDGYDGSFYYGGSGGSVWSSSVLSDDVDYAYYLSFDSSDCSLSDYGRCLGLSVRGVCVNRSLL